MEEKSIQILTKNRLFLSSGIAIVVVVAILIFALNYSSLWTGGSENGSQDYSPNMAQLTQEYKEGFKSSVAGYIVLEPASPEFLSATQQTKEKLLNLRVPAPYKDGHLRAIILLNKIEGLIASGQSSKISSELDNLSQIANAL